MPSSSNPNSGEPYGPPSDGGDDDSKFNAMLAAYRPLLTKLTFSSVMGYCSAITAKKIGKGIAFVAGLGFMALQGMAYAGFVDVNWKEVEKSVTSAVDTDKDGKITEKDMKKYWEKVKVILTNNIPDAGGFSLGFFYGLRG